MLKTLFFILFYIGFGIKFHFIGEFSVSEVFLLFGGLYCCRKINYSKHKDLKFLTKIYVCLILVQCVTEMIVENSFQNAAKGIAVNLFSYLHLIFLYYIYCKRRSVVGYFALGMVFRFLIFGSDRVDGLEEEVAFLRLLKFTIIPIVTYALIYVYIQFQVRNIELGICYLGLLLIILGARSGGGVIFISGFISWYFRSGKKVAIKNMKFTLIALLGLFYAIYVFYVNMVLSGEITSGNSVQLLRAENPYNPINLLMVGRSEVFVGFIAFMDRFWTGWGAWTPDPNMQYHMLQSTISNSPYNPSNVLHDVIPSHSVLIGSGMMNGVFAFIFMFVIFITILRKAVRLLSQNDKYIFIIVLCATDFLWNMLFSPQSAFRYILPFDMAFILASYRFYKVSSNGKDMFCYNR